MIFLSFAKVKETSYHSAKKSICQIITNLYNQYDFLLEGGILNNKEREFYQKVPADLGETVQAALLQIEEKNYQANLRAKGISEERIRKYGFAFCGKRVLIGRK